LRLIHYVRLINEGKISAWLLAKEDVVPAVVSYALHT